MFQHFQQLGFLEKVITFLFRPKIGSVQHFDGDDPFREIDMHTLIYSTN